MNDIAHCEYVKGHKNYFAFILLTFIPALRHLVTASGTLDLGGSMSDIKPTKHNPSSGKFSCSNKILFLNHGLNLLGQLETFRTIINI